MNRNLITTNHAFPSLLCIADGDTDLLMPFTREIFLLDCHIAGTTYRADIAPIAERLANGSQFRLQREPENEFDESAIAVYDSENNKLGYVPKTKNEVPARLLDAGKRLTAKLVAKEWNDSWLKLDIEIFLDD